MAAKKTKKPILVGPIRHNLEAFGVAILAAVLLKWFCIEAFQIPTSSMQPTLMGSSEAGVYDRILVNKLIQTFREPQRWDITVFKYPLQKNQNYVKRIVGMPNDRLSIGGGNVYQVEGEGASATYTPLRKPDDLQELMWKNVYPTRRDARAETKALGKIFAASPSRAVTETDTGFVLEPDGKTARLYFRDEPDGGMIDAVWDGYPANVAALIREQAAGRYPIEICPDVRLTATVTPSQQLESFAVAIEVVRTGFDKLVYALLVEDGKGRLEVRGPGQKVLGGSDPFDFPLAAGEAVEVAFAHVDDRLIAWRDGDEVMRWDSAQWSCREGCVVDGPKPGAGQKVIPQFVCIGKGEVRFDDVRIDRDQHYARDIAPEIIEVPDGHYYMLGDNVRQSIDSRGWTAITIGVDADDNIVPIDSPECVRTIRGNKRAMPLSDPPDRDETPIAIPNENVIVMIDEFGEILRLNGRVGPDWGPEVTFRHEHAQDGGADGYWSALDTTNTKGISFVPREDIEGRALMVFYPMRPFSWLTGNEWPDRAGFVR
ncbi:MAG: signal peptidase I [Planctomycetes bacterium]|nr:signal peptidase I [Planctomycetota bacterium]